MLLAAFRSLSISLTRLAAPTAIGAKPTTSQNSRDPHRSSALATIQIPKASIPAEIKYAVSFSMVNIQAERRPFVPPERAGPSASLYAPWPAKRAHFHLGDAGRGASFVLFLRFRCK